MAFGATPRDSGSIPLGSVYVPGSGLTALQGGGATTDASSNTSAPVAAAPVDGYKATYSATAVALATATSAGDYFTLFGSATKTIRLTYVSISLTGTAASVDIALAKRTAVDSGGTTATTTITSHDSTNAAATATAQGYSAGATAGAGANIRFTKYTFAAAAAQGPAPLVWDFGGRPSQCPTLRGTAQGIAINFSAIPASGSLDIAIEWTEE